MEIRSSAFDHRQWGQTSTGLILIPARVGALSALALLLEKTAIFVSPDVLSDKRFPRYLIFRQAVEPKAQDVPNSPRGQESLKPGRGEVYGRS